MAIEKEFKPVFYRVTITDGGSLANSGDADGFIDNTKPEQYSSLPATLANSLRKERANMRFEQLQFLLSERGSILDIDNIVATGADEDTDASEFAFTVSYDREETVQTEDVENNAGTFLSGTTAVERLCARALLYDITKLRFVIDPTQQNSTIYNGPQTLEVTADKLATGASISDQITVLNAQIAVSKISNV